jgi:hypothetical protein
MNAKEINAKQQELSDEIQSMKSLDEASLVISAGLAVAAFEIAAQVAEANEHLKRIAYPLITVGEAKPKWVRLVVDGYGAMVDAESVVAVTHVAGASDSFKHCHVVFGSGGSLFVEETEDAVCKKLGIPKG